MKTYNVQYGVGTAKYLVNFHDGKSTHRDGSRFFDCRIFSNKRKMYKFLRDLQDRGYVRM